MKNSARQTVGLWLIGILLAQAAWIVALPPFRGIDEPDHVFRASGVAHGQWRLTEGVAGGRGEAVYVPRALVEAASGQCETLAYKEEFDCAPFAERADGLVGIATGAGSYNPLYYAVVGWAGKSFEGAASLYAMRAASALLCALFLVAGLVALNSRRRPKIVWIAVAAGMTPTLAYSTILVAPNGLEIAAGFCLWAALLGIEVHEQEAELRNRWLLALAAVAGVVLVSLRTLGPLWALLIVLCIVAARGWKTTAQLAARHRVTVALGLTIVAAATAGALLWSRMTGLISDPATSEGVSESGSGTVFDIHGWVFQTVAAFPFRGQQAPLVVYPLVLAVVGTLLVMGLRRTSGRRRVAVALAITASLAVPLTLVALTMDGQGAGWQGRYALPFVVGVLPFAALLLDSSENTGLLRRRAVGLAAVAMLAVAHVVSVTAVQVRELNRDVSVQDGGWFHPPAWTTAAIMLLAWAVLVWSSERIRAHRSVGV